MLRCLNPRMTRPQMSGIRGLILTLLIGHLAGCASPMATQEARTVGVLTPEFEPSIGPTTSRVRTRGAPRTELKIPVEYLNQLNWDPAAYEGLPTLFEDDGPTRVRASRSASGPQTTQRWRPRSRRRGGRTRRAAKPFRTVGLSVTITRASGTSAFGHPLGRPGHAVRRSAHPVTRSAHPVSRPQHPVGKSAHPMKRPQHPVKRPGHAVPPPRSPGETAAAPDSPARSRRAARPNHPVGLPGHAIGLASHSVRSVPQRSKQKLK